MEREGKGRERGKGGVILAAKPLGAVGIERQREGERAVH